MRLINSEDIILRCSYCVNLKETLDGELYCTLYDDIIYNIPYCDDGVEEPINVKEL